MSDFPDLPVDPPCLTADEENALTDFDSEMRRKHSGHAIRFEDSDYCDGDIFCCETCDVVEYCFEESNKWE